MGNYLIGKFSLYPIWHPIKQCSTKFHWPIIYYENIRIFKYHLQHSPNLFSVPNWKIYSCLSLSLWKIPFLTASSTTGTASTWTSPVVASTWTSPVVPSLSQQMRKIRHLSINQILIRLSCGEIIHQSFNQIQITTYSRCVIFKAFDHFTWRSCKF